MLKDWLFNKYSTNRTFKTFFKALCTLWPVTWVAIPILHRSFPEKFPFNSPHYSYISVLGLVFLILIYLYLIYRLNWMNDALDTKYIEQIDALKKRNQEYELKFNLINDQFKVADGLQKTNFEVLEITERIVYNKVKHLISGIERVYALAKFDARRLIKWLFRPTTQMQLIIDSLYEFLRKMPIVERRCESCSITFMLPTDEGHLIFSDYYSPQDGRAPTHTREDCKRCFKIGQGSAGIAWEKESIVIVSDIQEDLKPQNGG